jgi:hypothetical protein
VILACFVLGLSTRKVATALLPVLGRPVSLTTVIQVGIQADLNRVARCLRANGYERFQARAAAQDGSGKRRRTWIYRRCHQ